MDSNERSVHLITLKLTDKEYMKIRDNIKAVHEKMSTARYVTVMAMYGYYVQVDFSELQTLTALFRKIKERFEKDADRLVEKCPLELYTVLKELEEVDSKLNILLTAAMDN
jgi:hypothetical protein